MLSFASRTVRGAQAASTPFTLFLRLLSRCGCRRAARAALAQGQHGQSDLLLAVGAEKPGLSRRISTACPPLLATFTPLAQKKIK